jgi:predicted transcriptional regulator
MPPRPAKPVAAPVADEAGWTFLTNHAHVLILPEREGDLVMRDIALRVGITERAVQRIVADLVGGGFVSVSKDGRRNSYTVDGRQRLRHPVESHRTVGDLLRLVR